jgi:hypothetical protein
MTADLRELLQEARIALERCGAIDNVAQVRHVIARIDAALAEPAPGTVFGVQLPIEDDLWISERPPPASPDARDAARYRLLRRQPVSIDFGKTIKANEALDETLDAILDAAIEREGGA